MYRIKNILEPSPWRPYPGPETGLDIGEVEIGTIHETGLPWRLPISDFPFIAEVGAIGQGKTSLLYTILAGLAGRLPFLLITPKEDTARLLVDPPIVKRAYGFDELRLALFTPPPGVKPDVWQRCVIEILAQDWELQYARSVLHECVDQLRDLYDQYSQRTGSTVCFTPSALIKSLKRSRNKYSDGAVAVLDTLQRVTGDVFECSQGQCVDDLFLHASSVLSIACLMDTRVTRFDFDWILEWIYQYLTVNGPNDGSPQWILAADDAHRLLTESNERSALMPLTHKYLIIRQSGIRLIAISQCPGDLAPAIFSQSGVIIQVGGLVHEHDIKAVGSAVGMQPKDWPYLQRVKKAEFIAREMSLGRYDRPFGGTVNYFPPATRRFSEAQRKAIMTPFLNSLPWQPAVPLEHVERALASVTMGAVPARTPQGLSPTALDLARDVYLHPWDFLHARNRRLGIAGRVAQNSKEELVNAAWVKEHAIPRRGKPPILLEPLAPLWNGLQVQRPSWGAKGGFVHAFCQHTIAERLKQTGFKHIAIEKFFGSKSVDVVATAPTGELVGFEVAISFSNLVDNLSKDFWVQPNFARITTMCLSQQEVSQAKQMIVGAPVLQVFLSRLSVEPIAHWL